MRKRQIDPAKASGRRDLPAARLGIAATAAVAVVAAPTVLALHALRTSARARGSAATLTVSATPSVQTVWPGQTARYRIVMRRGRNLRGTIRLVIVGGLPAGARARFAPPATSGSAAMLSVTTAAQNHSGRYRPRLRATSGGKSSTISIMLSISGPAAGFAIGGTVGDLHPGAPSPVNLALINPSVGPLIINGLTVAIQNIDAPRSSPALPCTPSDFSVRQFAGSYPLAIPGSSTRTLGQLGIPTARWPQVAIVDSNANQDGCQGASLTLSYRGTGYFG